MPDKMTESMVVAAWRKQSAAGREFFTEEGDSLQIISPGRLNDEQGADFHDAVIAINGELVRGDVEIHKTTGGWREHGHHLDPLYNRVILHVVMRHRPGTDTRLQDGRTVPVLALQKYISTPAFDDIAWGRTAGISGQACPAAERLSPESRLKGLDRSGDARFYTRIGRFRAEMIRIPPEQVFYRGLAAALGYSRNKMPFQELAARLPLSRLESAAASIPAAEYLARCQALLLGTAGFLEPAFRHRLLAAGLGEAWLEKLEAIRREASWIDTMSADDWHFIRVRPANSPLVRLLALSVLLQRYRESGLLPGLTGPVGESGESVETLERGLLLGGSENESLPAGSLPYGVTLLGGNRARDIVVNVVLPFVAARAGLEGDAGTVRQVAALYRQYPASAMNSVEQFVLRRLGLERRAVGSARRRQGLLHLYRNYCSGGRCDRCQASFSPGEMSSSGPSLTPRIKRK